MNKCLNPRCSKEQLTRGLCENCYQSALRLVRRGVVTWSKLESEGKAIPCKIRESNSGVRDWLLSTEPSKEAAK